MILTDHHKFIPMANRIFPTNWRILFAAVISGVLIYQFCVVVMSGYLAAVELPTQYFAWFGKPQQGLALTVLDLAIASAIFVLVSGAVIAVCRIFRNGSVALLFAILAGMLLCWLYWTVGFFVFAPQDLDSNVTLYPMKTGLQPLIFGPWWSLPSTLAPWCGFAFAAWLLRQGSQAAIRRS